MPTLTKSLHTVTVVTNIAAFLRVARADNGNDAPTTARKLLVAALDVLGYSLSDFDAGDPTVEKCMAAVKKVLATPVEELAPYRGVSARRAAGEVQE